MIDIYKEKFAYYERLLSLQFYSSEDTYHNPTKGEEREKFITFLIASLLPQIKFSRGILTDSTWQSKQVDFVKLNQDAINTGTIFRACDALIFMEIKSNAKTKDFVELNAVAEELKRINDKILVGMFCYKTEIHQRTVLKKFSIIYDKDIDGYDEYKKEYDEFPYIDFCYSLNMGAELNMQTDCYFLDRNFNNLTLYKGEPGITMELFTRRLQYE
ncbi:hypothetical protein NGB23_07985 [Staphylococcus xylosus]|uniref:Uncharacterized protein n=1 Tax=Staphylococcus xylosus TaxID=1288 RepID=A0A5R9B1U5_STAXY|nr:hypothetical protein [Staphylococcus xylosus]MEB7798869.1 hypothetical protein [Staphylococcus xylosus]PTH95348.1 hypothetical protein BU118_03490 [Staphylococcus xylosus]QDW87912.1 hypothetical protein DWB98_00230 [Staphylococcus xylosus]TLP89892.1 hypothetical protein FEZ53_10590 [Staphylococcus xylosus]